MQKHYKIIILILLLFPFNVYAKENITLDCNDNDLNNIVCAVSINTTNFINGVKADIKLSNNLEYVSFDTNSNWQGDASNNQIGLYNSNNVIGNISLGYLKLKLKDNSSLEKETVSLVNALYSNQNFEKIELDSVSADINSYLSNELSNLEVSIGKLNFSKDTLNYTLTTVASSVNITATKKDERSVLSGDLGLKELKYGNNIFNIYVTNLKGEKRTYTINIVREDKRSSENNLNNLSILGYNINFKEKEYVYNLEVDNNIDSIEITADLKKNTSFIKGYEPGIKKLNEGINTFYIKVSSENNSVKTYTVNITRKTNNVFAEDIKVNNNSIDFSPDKYEYKITVDSNTNKLDLDLKTNNDVKVDIIGNENFAFGENNVIIRLTKGNDKLEYKIIVVKLSDNLSSNNYLKSLEIKGYNIDFDKEIKSYELKINKEKKLDITAYAEEETANVKIENNNKLKNNSIIKIIVTAEDKTISEYSIKIIKEEPDYLLIIVISIEIIITIIIFSYLNKKDKRKNNEETDEEI